MSGRRPLVTNPYAKKKRSIEALDGGSGRSSGGNTDGSPRKNPPPTTNITTTTGMTPISTTVTRTSFSQVFSSVEDSHHFQNALREKKESNKFDSAASKSNKTMTHQEQRERAQQRAMDTVATTEISITESTGGDNLNQPESSAVAKAANGADQLLSDRDVQAMGASAHPHVLYVSPKQRGNIVLQFIRNVPTQFLRMVPDYLFSTTHCALFLSLKYHSLFPNYIHRRVAELQSDFVLRLLLVLVDVQDNAALLRQLNVLAVSNRMTLILAWTAEEAARYLETFKSFQGKDASLIQKRTSTNHADQVADFLTACSGINKTDAANLLGQFGSMRALATKGTTEELALVPGLGQVKVARLYEAFCKPFSKLASRRRRLQQQHTDQQDEVTVKSISSDNEEYKESKDRI